MSTIKHNPAVSHAFKDCGDPDCAQAVCVHYRAGLAAGADFIRAAEGGFARARAAAREAGGERPAAP
jgi:hypothetical protein